MMHIRDYTKSGKNQRRYTPACTRDLLMIVTSAHDAADNRLQRMRRDAKLTQTEAVAAANGLATKTRRPERFTVRALRRWELLGTQRHNPKLHGTRPATLAELSILVCVYGGSGHYLLMGDHTTHSPSDELIHCNSTVMSWPPDRRVRFIEWFQENIRP